MDSLETFPNLENQFKLQLRQGRFDKRKGKITLVICEGVYVVVGMSAFGVLV